MTVKEDENALAALLTTVRRLLDPGGCPWDRCQTVESLAPYVVEEAWELLDAARSGENGAVREELGDVLMLVMLIGDVAERAGRFTLSDTARAVTEKLVRRHPHVFSGARADDVAGVKSVWDAIKMAEGKELDDGGLPVLPAALPALSHASELGTAAQRRGFDWPDIGGPLAKISEEWGELRDAVARGDAKGIEHEVGDLLFAVTNLCRKTGTDPELALRAACARFRTRFGAIVREGGPSVLGDIAAMERIWEEAKEREKHGGS